MAKGVAEVSMGRPKKAREGGPLGVISVRGSEEWRRWVADLAEHERLATTDLIDRALVEYAERHGFARKAPKR